MISFGITAVFFRRCKFGCRHNINFTAERKIWYLFGLPPFFPPKEIKVLFGDSDLSDGKLNSLHF